MIQRPDAYGKWKNDRPKFPWPGPRFDWRDIEQTSMTERYRPFFGGPMSVAILPDWWHYRRILYKEHFAPGAFPSDVTLINCPQNSYWDTPLLGVDDATRDRALREARELSLSFLYWLQTEAPRHDEGEGYPEVRLRDDIFGTQHASRSRCTSGRGGAFCRFSGFSKRMSPPRAGAKPNITLTPSASARTGSTCIRPPRRNRTSA